MRSIEIWETVSARLWAGLELFFTSGIIAICEDTNSTVRIIDNYSVSFCERAYELCKKPIWYLIDAKFVESVYQFAGWYESMSHVSAHVPITGIGKSFRPNYAFTQCRLFCCHIIASGIIGAGRVKNVSLSTLAVAELSRLINFVSALYELYTKLLSQVLKSKWNFMIVIVDCTRMASDLVGKICEFVLMPMIAGDEGLWQFRPTCFSVDGNVPIHKYERRLV